LRRALPPFAYQSFVAPSGSSLLGGSFNEAYVSVSNNGGYSWTVKPIPCSLTGGSLDHNPVDGLPRAENAEFIVNEAADLHALSKCSGAVIRSFQPLAMR
jgi:hypothetical protein